MEEAKKIQPLRPLSAADTDLEYLSAASGGQVDMDRMRLELMGKSKGGSVMGVNVASDKKAGMHYADLIVDGHKTLESRNTDSLRPYVGKRVAIVRTGAGKAKAIGEVTIGEPMVVNKKKFHAMREHHMVPEGSQFDIKTNTKHLYPMHNPERYEEERDVGHGIVSRKVMHKAEGGEVDYRGEHTAPGPHYGAPLHDVSSNGMYPADFYGNNGRRYYANEGWDFDNDAYNKVTRVKNKPNAMVSIHRAVPTSVYKEALKKEAPLKHMIRKGDWVAINKEYARAHGESVLNGDYKIASMRVPAKHVWTNADSIHEWGYHPEEEKKASGGITHAHHLDLEERPL
jgi:predicted transcriptional regulator